VTTRACAIRASILAAALVASAAAVHAQGLLSTVSQGATSPAAQAPPVAQDPLGRQTPSGTVMGFLAAGARGDWQRASRYLDSKLPAEQALELARELKVLIDRGLSVDPDRLSQRPEGEQDQRAGKDHEIIGSIESESGKLDVILVRVRYGGEPPIWLFSPETLRGVSKVHEEFEPSFVEQYLPHSLTRGYGAEYMWWSWLVVLASILAAAAIAVAVTRVGRGVAAFVVARFSLDASATRWLRLFRPVGWLTFSVSVRQLSGGFLTLRQRYTGHWVATLFVIASVTWLGVTVLAGTMGRWARMLERRGAFERIALVRLAGRLLQTAAVVLGLLVLLRAVGINLTPVLAGLGVGGIAVALASQKTLENLFGGMMVIGDSPVRIGNYCRVGTLAGTVEDIGLRSTRLRTLGRTTISIPNADLASQSIENLATRDKMLFNHTLTLRYETTAEQLRFVLAEARALLYRHEKVESSTARVRLVRFAQSGLDVEIFAYIVTRDFEAFLGMQEDLLLRLMDTVEESGTALAFPSQTMYFTRDPGLDATRAAESARKVDEWRARGDLPFPDMPEERRRSLAGGIPYPPDGSALRKDVPRT
jgi:MscS family membrane protein